MRYLIALTLTLLMLNAMAVSNAVNVEAINGKVSLRHTWKTAFKTDFSQNLDGVSLTYNYNKGVRLERRDYKGRHAAVIVNAHDVKQDTAFNLTTRRIPTEKSALYQVEFQLAASKHLPVTQFINHMEFYNAEGKSVSTEFFRLKAPENGYSRQIITGQVPQKATEFIVAFGSDNPNVNPQDVLAFSSIQCRILAADRWERQGEFVSDHVRLKPGNAPRLTWKLMNHRGKVRFQLAFAPDRQGLPGTYSAFCGPDGTPGTFYTQSGTHLPRLAGKDGWLRYKAQLFSSGQTPTVLNRVSLAGTTHQSWKVPIPPKAPELRMASPTPTTDRQADVTVAVHSHSVINWEKLAVKLDGKDVRDRIALTDGGFTIKTLQPYQDGIHEVDISMEDVDGQAGKTLLFFRIGAKRTRGVVSLRDDGMTLIDGVPFFPIGVYNVRRRPINSQDLGVALRDLKACGVNMVHTYSWKETPALIREAEKQGMKVWMAGSGGANCKDMRRVMRDLQPYLESPAPLAWYLGDDTASHNTAEEVLRRNLSIKDVAPHLLTTQADLISTPVNNLLATTSIFMPELYYLQIQGDAFHGIAKVHEGTVYLRRLIRQLGIGPRGVWPIIQYYKGWGHKHFPSYSELRAMSFAALIGGANGITWYTYNSTEEQGKWGISTSHETWNAFQKVAREIADLTPILVERDAPTQVGVNILEGRKLCHESTAVVALTKRHKGRRYVLALNLSTFKPKAEFQVGKATRAFLFPSGKSLPLSQGKIVKDFTPHEVFVFAVE